MDSSSSVQLHQEIMDSQSLDSMLMCTKSESDQQHQQQEKKPRPADEQALKCPRCDSSNTKFCYYNNYSLTQPRYFCKSCRRYWTKGGTLRNVPVGGGCRKNKRCSSASRRSNTPDHLHNLITSPTSSSQHLISPLTSYDHHHNNNAHDLTLAFAHHHQNGNIPILGNSGNTHFDLFGNHFSGNLLDSLRSGLVHHDHNNNNNNNNNNNINNGLHLYYGGNLENVENGGGNVVNDLSHEDHQQQQLGMHFDLLHHQNHNHHQQDIMSNGSSGASTPTVKQELGDHNGPSSVLLNYIMNGGDQMDHHAPRESWNTGVLGSSWHNLLHSPLM